MRKVQLITFKGCQSTVDFRSQLGNLIDTENLDVEVEMIFVPLPKKAEEMGMFGSPTLFIDGLEVQQERRGPAGCY